MQTLSKTSLFLLKRILRCTLFSQSTELCIFFLEYIIPKCKIASLSFWDCNVNKNIFNINDHLGKFLLYLYNLYGIFGEKKMKK